MHPETAILVFLRRAVAGKVKTRLGATIGHPEAAAVYERMVNLTLDVVQECQIPAFLYYDGDLPVPDERLPGFIYVTQSAGDLGDRMFDALAGVQGQYPHVILIGTDCPEITADILDTAMSCLSEHDIVLGPATDGGYYLIGSSRPVMPRLFADISWSTPDVLAQTLERCGTLNLSVALLPVLSDVDTAEDLRRIAPHLNPENPVHPA